MRDSAALLDATSGPEPGDPYAAPPPARPFLQEVGADPGKLRIAFTTRAPSGVPIHPECVRAVEEAAKLCEGLGHRVEEGTPEFDVGLLIRSFRAVWAAGAAQVVDGEGILTGRKPSPGDFEELTWALAEQGRAISGPAYLMAVAALQGISRQVAGFFVEHDLWLTPTVAEPPLLLGRFDPPPGQPLAPLQRALAFVPFTPIANATGQPAMSVPLVWNAAGLPIGVHFVARLGDEATLFRLAAQLEAARPWAPRRPPVFAA